MMNQKDEYNVGTCQTFEELADKLLNYGWTLCTGFEYGGYLFLNDAFSEDGAMDDTGQPAGVFQRIAGKRLADKSGR